MPPDPLLLLGMMLLTIAAYALARDLYLRYQHPLLQPVFLGAAIIILALSICDLTFDQYRPAKEILTWPLGPVTVALAVPVYNQRARLRVAALPLVCGVALGSTTTIAGVIGLATLGQIERAVLQALAIKSVTAPIAIELARLHGGDPSLAAGFVIVTGMLGAMFGPLVLTRCGISDPVARGIALGTTSHGQGTAAALLEHEAAGAMSSLAMVGGAVVTAVIAPFYIPALLRLLGT
jgi:putative effector of murein hydrolase